MKTHVLKILVLLTILLFFISSAYSQQELSDYKNKLKLLQQEYEELNRELNREKEAELSSVSKLDILDRQIRNKNQAIYQLNKGVKQSEREASRLKREISMIDNQLGGMKKEFAKRAVYLYKYKRNNEIKTILTSSSFNDFLLAVKYYRIVSDVENKQIENLNNKISLLNTKERELNETLAEKSRLLTSENRSKRELNSKRGARRRELNKIRKDKELTLQMINKKQGALKQVERYIIQLTSNAGRDESFPSGVFPELRGRLPLPVYNGKITAHAGVNIHPVYKTKTMNTGIDISAPTGTSVRAVALGKVVMIRWIPGFGSTVFIDHNDGYYTAYAHMNEIFVEEGKLVSGGDEIGKVGDDSSLDGSKLTFFVYKDGKNLDPEEWLRK